MDNHMLIKIEKMTKKLNQHEEIIIQLLEIIASTNRRVSDLSNNQKWNNVTIDDRVHKK